MSTLAFSVLAASCALLEFGCLVCVPGMRSIGESQRSMRLWLRAALRLRLQLVLLS